MGRSSVDAKSDIRPISTKQPSNQRAQVMETASSQIIILWFGTARHAMT